MRSPRPALQLVLAVVSRPWITLAICLALTAFCSVLALTKLTLSADQNKLFSAKVPFFRDFLGFVEKFPENEALYVLIEPKDFNGPAPSIARWTGAADAIHSAVEKLGPYVKRVERRIGLDELGDQGLLFDDPVSMRRSVEELRRFTGLLKLTVERPGALARAFGNTPGERLFGALAAGDRLGTLTRLLGGTPENVTESAPLALEVARSLKESLGQRVESESVGSRGAPPVLPDLLSIGAADPGRLGYFWTSDETDPARKRHILLVRVYLKPNYGSLTGLTEAVEEIRKAVRKAANGFGEFSIGVTGRPALEADEMGTTERDSKRAEIAALSAVFVGLVLLLRSFWLALAAELALGVGVAWTFGWATITLGELNLLSIVFFLALIGIGMDYLVQILSRYRHEASKPGRDPRRDGRRIWVAVFRQVGPPITTACLGAAGAFLVSLLTDFAGAASLGLIAGGGLILCLLAGYTFLPALLMVVPLKRRTRAMSGEHRTESRQRKREAEPSENSGGRSRRLFWVGPGVWVALLGVGWFTLARPRFNPSLLDLQADNLESVRLIRKLPTWSLVVLSKDLNALRAAREAVANRMTVGRTDSVLNAYDNAAWLKQSGGMPAVKWDAPDPATAEDLPRLALAAERLAGVYEKSPAQTTDSRAAGKMLREVGAALRVSGGESSRRAVAMLTAWQEGLISKLRQVASQASPAGVNLQTIPRELRAHFESDDGTYALYLYPKADLWDQAQLIQFVEDVEPAIAQLPVKVTLTGIAHNIYHSTTSIRASFYTATAYAMGLIVLLVLIDLRHIGHTLMAVSVLGLGLPMLLLLMGAFGIHWNFANFFGLPILIGAGHEYGVFMVHRYRESLANPKKGWPKWDVADGALLLCAFVTSSSFGFFAIMAHHKGLQSLGLVMALGSACIYLATVVVVRPVLKGMLGRRVRGGG